MILQGALFILGTLAVSKVVNIRFMEMPVSKFQLKLGYKNNLVFQEPVVIDMEKTPHLFVCGLSGSGKSKMVEYAVREKNVVLMNAFSKDFKSIKNKRIIGNSNILKYLNNLLDDLNEDTMDSEPLYVVIDELLVLCMDKAITKSISDLLAIGRHYNIFIIGISQIGTKESVKFKDLFNARVCFRQVEESSYRTILGFSPEDKKIRQREFYLYSDDIYRGYTYTIK